MTRFAATSSASAGERICRISLREKIWLSNRIPPIARIPTTRKTTINISNIPRSIPRNDSSLGQLTA